MSTRLALRLTLPAVLGVAGWNECLPVGAGTDGLFRPVQIIPGLWLDDALLVLCVCAYASDMFAALVRGKRGPAGIAALLLCALAGYCVFPGATGPEPLRDVLESCKLALGALLLVVLAGIGADDARRALRWMIIGMGAGTIVNLIETFSTDRTMIGSLPMLLGQNGPGTAMGICVCLAAWLAISAVALRDALISFAGALLGLAGASISYSKIGMICALLGVTSMGAVVTLGGPSPCQVILRRLAVATLAATIAVLATGQGIEIASSLREFVRIKVASAVLPLADDPGTAQGSMSARFGYVVGTLEIVEAHPLGVGYSGFGSAIRATSTYQSGRSPEESDDPKDFSGANPHATPLYYASAGGVIGLLLCLLVMGAMLRCIVFGLGSMGTAAKLTAVASCVAYLVVFTAVPSLLQTKLLIGPVGIAVALGSGRAQGRPGRRT